MRLAVGQTPGTTLTEWPETLALVENLVFRADFVRADLLLLPECVWPAYCIGSKREYHEARAEGLPDPSVFLQQLADQARRYRMAICAGFIEEQGDVLANAAVLISASGDVLGLHRKCFLWDFDCDWFEAGDRIDPIDADGTRIGVMICADARLPEIPATLVAGGANLIVQPTAWVNVGTRTEPHNPQPEYLIRARARELHVPIASASKCGRESDTEFVGRSLICDADGNLLAQAGPDEPTFIAADVTASAGRPPAPTAAQRARLLSKDAVTLPSMDAPALDVTLSDDDSAVARSTHCSRSSSPQAGVACLQVTRSRVVMGLPDSSAIRTLDHPAPELYRLGEIGVAVIADYDANSFAPLRALALDGAHLAVVLGDDVPDFVLRARATENRIFLVAAGEKSVTIIDIAGNVIARHEWQAGSPPGKAFHLHLPRAADKHFAPGTDAFAGRTPEIYRL